MCGRFALARRPAALARVFALAEAADCTPRYNIAPTTDIAAVRRSLHSDRCRQCPGGAGP